MITHHTWGTFCMIMSIALLGPWLGYPFRIRSRFYRILCRWGAFSLFIGAMKLQQVLLFDADDHNSSLEVIVAYMITAAAAYLLASLLFSGRRGRLFRR